MTHANVGSLLVFDPSKMHLVRDKGTQQITNASTDAVVGLITERGEASPRPTGHLFLVVGFPRHFPRRRCVRAWELVVCALRAVAPPRT
jgi:hypothetical protein